MRFISAKHKHLVKAYCKRNASKMVPRFAGPAASPFRLVALWSAGERSSGASLKATGDCRFKEPGRLGAAI